MSRYQWHCATLARLTPNIYRLGQVLCAEGQLQDMKIQNYYEWFRGGVGHWLDIAVYKALKRIDRAVEFDTLQAVDNSVQYSSSAVDTLTIFYQIKVFWTQLAWPDVEGSYTFIAKIIDVSFSISSESFDITLLSAIKSQTYSFVRFLTERLFCRTFASVPSRTPTRWRQKRRRQRNWSNCRRAAFTRRSLRYRQLGASPLTISTTSELRSRRWLTT